MRNFHLIRDVDISGISGKGQVAEGTIFTNTKVVLTWYSNVHNVEIFDSIMDLLNIHGHKGSSYIKFTDTGEIVR